MMESSARKRPRRSYSPAFKAETVDMCRRGDRPIGEIAREYDLPESTVREWVRQADIDAGVRFDGPTTVQRKERARLRREKRRLRERRWLWIFPVATIAMTLGGAIAVAGGGLSVIETHRFLGKALASNGVVVKLVREESTTRDSDGTTRTSILYCPQIRFVTSRGQQVEFESGDCARPASFLVGDSVRVLYDPQNPTDTRLNAWFSLWGQETLLVSLGFALMIGGSVATYVGLGDIRDARRRRAKTLPATEESDS